MTDDEAARIEREIKERQAQLADLKAKPYESREAAVQAAKQDPEAFNERLDALKLTGRRLYEKEEA